MYLVMRNRDAAWPAYITLNGEIYCKCKSIELARELAEFLNGRGNNPPSSGRFILGDQYSDSFIFEYENLLFFKSGDNNLDCVTRTR